MDQPDRDRGHRPLAFDKMEGLVREMQDPETGVPVRSQKLFLTSIPSAFSGYDLIEWLMERLNIEESVEAVHIGNQFCQYGYFFPVSDSKNLVVKDDSSLYRFQTPYYWPWQHRSPDNIEYAIYLVKRTLRNKQRHGLEEYEIEALTSLKKNLQNKWDFISMQAEEQVRLAKERKKGDKIVSDSQERAYWRVYRPPPGYLSLLEPVPVPDRSRGGCRAKKRMPEDLKREVDFLRSCLVRTRVKVSQALDNLIQHCETYTEYDPLISGAQPSNPWISEDPTFWELNGPLIEIPTEKRVKRWAITMEELVSDPTGLKEFTNYLRKEYSHENIRFWMAVNDLRRSAQSQIQRKVREIFDEFLAPGAPCEINIDGKTMERVHQELRSPTRFTFDSAAEHVYTLLLKKDCYPRFIRSEHYKNLLATGIQPSQKKRFFGFGGPMKKKPSTSNAPNTYAQLQQQGVTSFQQQGFGSLGQRRGSDRSLSGSVHELAVSGVKDLSSRVTHSHSQSNLSDIPYRDPSGAAPIEEVTKVPDKCIGGGGESLKDDICPWDSAIDLPVISPEIMLHPQGDKKQRGSMSAAAGSSLMCEDIYPWDTASNQPLPLPELKSSRKNSMQVDSGSSSSDISVPMVEVSDRLKKSCGLQQPSLVGASTVESDKNSRVSCEERVIARIQTVRKYSTASIIGLGSSESRRSSVTTKPSGSTRPSVSSSEDFALGTAVQRSFDSSAAMIVCTEKQDRTNKSSDDPCLRTYKKTRKRSSVSVAPLISVSSVVDDTAEETCTNQTLQDAVSVTEAKEDPVSCTSDGGDRALHTQGVVATWAEHTDSQSRKVNEICPWEDEESCKVDTPFVKTYATLGYL
ncbi:regulator of G-protein signaling 9 isoform X2 [Zootermopsis nevadensis]|uniref:Regulator of G-protein signaling 9 n=1 Tax=Zootermopsis nevadensis TaxID=136037 RepID=A0A067QTA2_ZOONE|nr:regulator of G-protein signaling 9 isoform X2 [Zootermopsis nevadensis]KDR13220.1 Regulator of G-protein signaling 9 [Zootermopsis nevadensis]